MNYFYVIWGCIDIWHFRCQFQIFSSLYGIVSRAIWNSSRSHWAKTIFRGVASVGIWIMKPIQKGADLYNTDMTGNVVVASDRNMTCLIRDKRTGCHLWGSRVSMMYNLITDMESRSQFTQTFHRYVIPVYAFINRLHYICLRLWRFVLWK